MKTLFKVTLITGIFSFSLFGKAVLAQDSSDQYNTCQAIVKQALGEESIVKVKSSKTRSGVTTIKLQVVPPTGGRSVMRCISDANTGGEVSVVDKNGNKL